MVLYVRGLISYGLWAKNNPYACSTIQVISFDIDFIIYMHV